MELSGGYQLLNGDDGEVGSLSKGWYADASYNLNTVIGLVGEVGGGYKTFELGLSNQGMTLNLMADRRVHKFMGGVRFHALQTSWAVLFFQALVGQVRSSVDVTAKGVAGEVILNETLTDSANYLGIQLGWGVNLHLSDRVGLRLAADRLRISREDASANLFRFTSGIVLLIGGR